MKKLFLTSSVNYVASDFAVHLGKGLKLVFINTPAEPERGDLQWLEDDRNALINAGFIVTDYTITGKTKNEIGKDLSEYDVIYVSGGNTFYFMEKIQETESKEFFQNYIEGGKIYIGTSAGSIAAGPDISPVRKLGNSVKAIGLKNNEGLNLVDFVIFPHWGSEHFQSRYFGGCLEDAYTTQNKIILLADNQYVKVEGDTY